MSLAGRSRALKDGMDLGRLPHLYAFSLIVLEKVRLEGISLLLVAPYWPSRIWFSDLVSPQRLSLPDSGQ